MDIPPCPSSSTAQSRLKIVLYFHSSALPWVPTLKAEQEMVTAQFQIALNPSRNQPSLTFPTPSPSLSNPSHVSQLPLELPPNLTHLSEFQSLCSQAILSTKSAICLASKDLCVPKILPDFFPFHYVSWSNKTPALLSNHASLSRLFKMILPPVNRTSCSDNSCISPFIRIA